MRLSGSPGRFADALGSAGSRRLIFVRALARSRHIPWAASIGVVFAVLAVVTLTLQHLWFERQLAVSAAAREVAMRATLLASRLDAALSTAPHASPAAVFRRVLEAHPDERLAEAILVDRYGRRIAVDARAKRRRLAAHAHRSAG